MACAKWEEVGLLYTSGELDARERHDFLAHLEGCTECRAEYEQYTGERKKVFALEVLGEEPSAKVNAEIVRICSAPRTVAVGFKIFGLALTRPVMAALFLALGLTGGTYIAYNVDNASNVAAKASVQPEVPTAQPASPAPTTVAATSGTTDSTTLDSTERARPFPQSSNGGSGVVPVDLQQKP